MLANILVPSGTNYDMGWRVEEHTQELKSNVNAGYGPFIINIYISLDSVTQSEIEFLMIVYAMSTLKGKIYWCSFLMEMEIVCLWISCN